MGKDIKKAGTDIPENRGNFFPTDENHEIIEGNYETPVGEVKIKKIERAKHYDVISLARAMNTDFAGKTKELFEPEVQAVKEAIQTGIYAAFRPTNPPYDKQDCLRINSECRCFCGHIMKEHKPFDDKNRNCPCDQQNCKCKHFRYAPMRPEDFGEFWLTKRRNFVRSEYRMKCQCKHTHEEHEPYPSPFRCRAKGCGCGAFMSASVCAACDQHWQDHDTVFETEKERRDANRQVRDDWMPFSELPTMRDIALTGQDNPAIEQLSDAIPEDKRPKHTDNNTPFHPS